MENNKFKYELSVGSVEGFFNIYQAISGRIFIQMGNLITPLTLKQVEDLKIDCYSLLDFDHDDFKKAYGLCNRKGMNW